MFLGISLINSGNHLVLVGMLLVTFIISEMWIGGLSKFIFWKSPMLRTILVSKHLYSGTMLYSSIAVIKCDIFSIELSKSKGG